MTASASFRVDPRLTAILGESYSSSEQSGFRHSPFVIRHSKAPIVVADNGSGMKERELRLITWTSPLSGATLTKPGRQK